MKLNKPVRPAQHAISNESGSSFVVPDNADETTARLNDAMPQLESGKTYSHSELEEHSQKYADWHFRQTQGR